MHQQPLKETDLYSAFLYAEYALELGNFGMYFESIEKGDEKISFRIDERFWIFILGLAIGLIPYLLSRKKKKPRKKKKR